VEKQIRAEGLDKILEEAGFELRQPGCSACLAMNEDKVPAGKYCVSTSNRNFEGRQGPGSRTILASPLVAAAAAITGQITDPRKNTFIALLRGINVGGKNVIKMEQLKQVFVDLGFSDVKTYIQSGNVIFRTLENNKLNLMNRIENQLQKEFSAEIKTLVLTIDDLTETIENAPENFGTEPEKFRYDVWFLLPPATVNELVSTIRLREGVDFLQAGKNAIYTSRLTSQMSRSYFSKIMQSPISKNVTIRNWNTTTKLWELSNF
jgi:uncharacterized protein (DUF1697 family)